MKPELVKATNLLNQNKLFEAEVEIKSQPECDDTLNMLASIAYSSGRIEEAIEIIKDVDNVEAWIAKAVSYESLGDTEKSLEYFEKVHEDGTIDVTNIYLQGLDNIHADDKIIEIASKSNTLISKMILAGAYVRRSELSKACELYDAAIEKYPNLCPHYIQRVISSKDLSTVPFKAEKLRTFSESLAINKEHLYPLFGATGKLYEFEKDYEVAFSFFEKCNETRSHYADQYRNDYHILIKQFEEVESHFDDEYISRAEPIEECPLVFIVGMPRSGTTLVEQTLISHTDISTIGETGNITKLMSSVTENKFESENEKEALNSFLAEYVGEYEGKFVIDKMPGNYHFLGLIYRFFPGAKFIYCKRDDMENCFSCYVTPFSKGHEFSNSFDTVAMEYVLHEMYMAHWLKILPKDTITTVNYEDMVANHQSETSRLLEFLGLDWQDSCAKFYKVKRNVNTASLAQVVKPIYKSSVNKTDKYYKMLLPLKDELSKARERG